MFRVRQQKFSFFIFLGFFLAFFNIAFSAGFEEFIPAKPEKSLVYDENHLLNATETKLFNDLSNELSQKANISVVALLFDHLDKRLLNDDFAREITKSWKLPGKDNILIFASQQKKLQYIYLGGSLRELIPETDLSHLFRRNLTHAFDHESYSARLLSFEWEIASFIAEKKQLELSTNGEPYELQESNVSSLMILFIMFVFFLLLMAKFSGRRSLLKNSKPKEEETGFGGGFGSMHGGFGGGFGRGSAYNRNLYKD